MKATTNALWAATLNSIRGMEYGIRAERAIRQETIALVVAVPIGALVAPSIAWYVAMIGALLVLLAVELLNTAIEKLADRVTRDHDAAVGRVKDFGSAAVACMLCLSALIWGAALATRFGWI